MPKVNAKAAAPSEKQAIRERIWALLEQRRAARFPGAHGRIPNFLGAEACADRLAKIEPWRKARAIKANPDSPQTAIRRRALEEGKIVYMAVPCLRRRNVSWNWILVALRTPLQPPAFAAPFNTDGRWDWRRCVRWI